MQSKTPNTLIRLTTKPSCIHLHGNTLSIANPKLRQDAPTPPTPSIHYTFARIYQTDAALFLDAVQPFLQDHHAHKAIFTYGASATGKSTTLNSLLLQIVQWHLAHHSKLQFSAFHIYNDDIIDLIQTLNTKLTINEADSAVRVLGLGSQEVHSLDAFHSLFAKVQAQLRQPNAKRMNANCGVSFIVYVINDQLSLIDMPPRTRVSAASKESLKGKECIFINQSLQCFEKVVRLLGEGAAHVPFRESKITRYCKEVLRRNNWLMVCCVGGEQFDETVRTLEFASQCQLIS